VVAANPDLSSELINSYELSLVGRPVSKLGVRATYFDSDITDLIARTTFTGSGNFIGIDDNIGQVDINGVELEANYEVNDKFEIESTATYTDSVNKVTNENTRTVVPYKLNLSFVIRPLQQWTLVWDNFFRWNPSTDTDNALYEGADAQDWILSNLTVTNEQAFNIKGLNLTFAIRNIFDEAYGQVDPRSTVSPDPRGPFITSYHPQESMNFMLGINYHF
jgi:outer membrane receptor protein involved in Fe transport